MIRVLSRNRWDPAVDKGLEWLGEFACPERCNAGWCGQGSRRTITCSGACIVKEVCIWGFWEVYAVFASHRLLRISDSHLVGTRRQWKPKRILWDRHLIFLRCILPELEKVLVNLWLTFSMTYLSFIKLSISLWRALHLWDTTRPCRVASQPVPPRPTLLSSWQGLRCILLAAGVSSLGYPDCSRINIPKSFVVSVPCSFCGISGFFGLYAAGTAMAASGFFPVWSQAPIFGPCTSSVFAALQDITLWDFTTLASSKNQK